MIFHLGLPLDLLLPKRLECLTATFFHVGKRLFYGLFERCVLICQQNNLGRVHPLRIQLDDTLLDFFAFEAVLNVTIVISRH